MKKLETTSYQKVLDDFRSAINWITNYEVSVQSSRMQHYKNTLELLNKSYAEGTTRDNFKGKNFEVLINAMYEAHELTCIWEGLKDYRSDDLRSRLQKFIGGPQSVTEERDSNGEARNIGFELLMAAHMVKSGLDIILDREGDLTVSFDGKPIYIECKRIHSPKKLRKNINKAGEQLARRYNIEANAKGLIAISITKIINPDHKSLIANEEGGLGRESDKIIDNFIRQHETMWQTGFDPRTIGVLVSLQFPSIIESSRLPTMANMIGLNNIVRVDTPEYQDLLKLVSKLQSPFK